MRIENVFHNFKLSCYTQTMTSFLSITIMVWKIDRVWVDSAESTQSSIQTQPWMGRIGVDSNLKVRTRSGHLCQHSVDSVLATIYKLKTYLFMPITSIYHNKENKLCLFCPPKEMLIDTIDTLIFLKTDNNPHVWKHPLSCFHRSLI